MKLTKRQIQNIVNEELRAVLSEMKQKLNEELSVGDIYRKEGTEASNSHEVEIINVFGNVLVVKIIGSGFGDLKPGEKVPMKKDDFRSQFTQRSVEDGQPVNTVDLSDKIESPTDVLRSLGYMSEGLKHHVLNKKPLTENIYRIGSDSYFDLIKEAREEFKKGNYSPLNEEEREMLESDLGEWAMFEGERVPLDFPMYEETLLKSEERDVRKRRKKRSTNRKAY